MQTDNIIQLITSVLHDEDRLKYVEEMRKVLPLHVLINEYKILKLRTPRQLGASTAALKLLTRYHDSVMFVRKSDGVREIIRRDPIFKDKVFSFYNFEHAIHGKHFAKLDLVIFDNLDYVANKTESDMNLCMQMLSSVTSLFVVLG